VRKKPSGKNRIKYSPGYFIIVINTGTIRIKYVVWPAVKYVFVSIPAQKNSRKTAVLYLMNNVIK